MSDKAVLQRAAFFYRKAAARTEAQARAGAKIKGSVRNADARSARARQGRVKIEARAGAAAFDISPSFRSGGRYAQAKSRRLSRSEARCRACRGNSDAPASATRVGGESGTRLAVALATSWWRQAGTQNGATPHADCSFLMIPVQEDCGNL